jgi:hypothetical protein
MQSHASIGWPGTDVCGCRCRVHVDASSTRMTIDPSVVGTRPRRTGGSKALVIRAVGLGLGLASESTRRIGSTVMRGACHDRRRCPGVSVPDTSVSARRRDVRRGEAICTVKGFRLAPWRQSSTDKVQHHKVGRYSYHVLESLLVFVRSGDVPRRRWMK